MVAGRKVEMFGAFEKVVVVDAASKASLSGLAGFLSFMVLRQGCKSLPWVFATESIAEIRSAGDL